MLEGINTMNRVSKNIAQWTNMVSLHLNQDKTRAIYFGSGHFIDQLDKLNLPDIDMGNGIFISFVHEVKSLGVILDSKLSWEPQVSSVGKKINKVLYTLRFIRHYTSENLRIRLIQALVSPHLDYCSTVLLDVNKSLRERI